MSKIELTKDDNFPILPLINTVLFPYMITPIIVGRPASILAVEKSLNTDSHIVCVTQRIIEEYEDDPKARDLYRLGTEAKILNSYKLPDGKLKILIKGIKKKRISKFYREQHVLYAKTNEEPEFDEFKIDEFHEALINVLKSKVETYIRTVKEIPNEIISVLKEIENVVELYYFTVSNLPGDFRIKQKFYEEKVYSKGIQKLIEIISKEISVHQIEKKIENNVKIKLNKIQRDFFLQEQIKAIHKELGITEEEKSDLVTFKEKIKTHNLSPEVKKKANEELKKLSRLSPSSQEYGVVYNYLSWIFDIPWENIIEKEIDITKSENILNEDHFGLKIVKQRILEYLSVMKLTNKVRGQILCFVGPPGVGKTSLGKSIAKATGREFVRLSLGGVRDEAEIRGHRRTYVGAMPGVIIQSLKKAGVKNPLVMMDEIDKMSTDFRGDPSAALLEVLDPEQNSGFRDHYLDFEYDLSNVLFITTANTLSTIPQPLIDRMELIEIPGYTEYEKKEIAIKHLIPRILNDHETNKHFKIHFKEESILKIINSYTREAGVRELDRKLADIVRKSIKKYIEKKIKNSVTINAYSVKKYLGVEKHLYSEVNKKDKVGVITGLAWTMSGGDTLQIEVMSLPGDGKLKLTGQLGDVMQESAQAAYTLARKFAKKYRYDQDFYKKQDIHLHIPEGAIPKDGPSAGITMTTAIISAISNKKVKHNLAMTGEVTLTGQVLAIGGLPEKLIAAKRAGIKNILIPKLNEPHLSEVADEIKKDLNITFVSRIEEVLDIALIL